MAHDYKTQGELIVNRPVNHWAPFDRRIANDTRISIEARGVLCWIGTRCDDHRLFLRHLQQQCGLSQARWQRIRKELESYGYMRIERLRVNGKFTWKYTLNLVYSPP